MEVFEISPVKYIKDELLILDQTKLPNEEKYIAINTKEDLYDAIYHLKVRGAPAIGVAAAYGICVLANNIDENDYEPFVRKLKDISEYIASARPTAVNLTWALDRIYDKVTKSNIKEVKKLKNIIREEAELIRAEDEQACYKMGEYGLSLLKKNMGILTHCNAGTIATSKYGTCLAPIYLGEEQGYKFKVYADETRPLLQGARLTCWELNKSNIDITLICDNMASIVMKNGLIDAVVVGCDRMAANGDGANKIGTSGVAILAKEYNIPFYMYVPTSTIDINTKSGKDIKIEHRKSEEVYKLWYKESMAPEGIKTYNPAFDVTDAKYITAVITEKGILRPPYEVSIKELFNNEGKLND